MQETMDFTPQPAEPVGEQPPATEAPRSPSELPAAFGRYAVRSVLGQGGFGTVYLGHDSQLDRPVAIKVLRGGKETPAGETERFLQEARRVARLRHVGYASSLMPARNGD